VWWIRQAILQALAEQSRIVRVPLNRAGTLHRIGKRANALLQELGREPTRLAHARSLEKVWRDRTLILNDTGIQIVKTRSARRR
jgi:DNA-directed RNA polymerase sigma subunit (sigma70/sigma32)